MERKRVIKRLLHAGVPLTGDGSHDWTKFRELCKLSKRTDEETEHLVKTMMDVGVDQHTDLGQDDEDTDDNEDNEGDNDSDENCNTDDRTLVSAITAAQIRERFDGLTRLRRTFLKYRDEELKEYFSLLRHWRCMPGRWTSEMEFVFFREIFERGLSNGKVTLTMSEFEGVLEDVPRWFLRPRAVLYRLKYILGFIDGQPLETLRKAGIGMMGRMPQEAALNLIPIPNIAYDENGSPTLPIHLSRRMYVSDLGRIVTDRRGFHTAQYIYPVGFRSSRL
jgi:hypothetical protein